MPKPICDQNPLPLQRQIFNKGSRLDFESQLKDGSLVMQCGVLESVLVFRRW